MRVLVTGAGSGIGAATSDLLESEGVEVIRTDRSGPDVIGLDVTRAGDWERVVDAHWPLDGLVNCAGIREISPLVDISEEDFERTLAVNLKGPFLGTRAVARRWLDEDKPGRIVNVASASGIRASFNMPHYCASKAGLIMFTKATAVDLAPRGIRVNAVAPGAVDTPMAEVRYRDPVVRAAREASLPVRRIASAAEIASAISFLLSDSASYIVGEVLSVDGGLTVKM